MKARKVGIVTTMALASTLLFAPAANAATGWHGPFSNRVTCIASLATIKLRKPSVPIEEITLCQKHDDGKWWYRY